MNWVAKICNFRNVFVSYCEPPVYLDSDQKSPLTSFALESLARNSQNWASHTSFMIRNGKSEWTKHWNHFPFERTRVSWSLATSTKEIRWRLAWIAVIYFDQPCRKRAFWPENSLYIYSGQAKALSMPVVFKTKAHAMSFAISMRQCTYIRVHTYSNVVELTTFAEQLRV